MFGLLFDEVDKDKNGSVTLEELKLRMQPSVSRHDIKHFVQVKKKKVPLTLSFSELCYVVNVLNNVKSFFDLGWARLPYLFLTVYHSHRSRLTICSR